MAHIQATGFYMVGYDFSRAWIVTSRGTGLSAAIMYIKVAAGCTLLATDGVYFCTDWNGSNPTDTWTPTPGSFQHKYVYCPSGSGYIVFNDPDLLLSAGNAASWSGGSPFWNHKTSDSTTLANTPSVTIDNWNYPNCINIYAGSYTLVIANISISQLSRSLLYFLGVNSGAISGNLSDLPSTTKIFALFYTNAVSGNISDIPASVEYFRLASGSTVTGDIANLKEGLLGFVVGASNTISGDIADLPSTLQFTNIGGSNTISGSIVDIQNANTSITIGGSNTILGDVSLIHSAITTLSIYGNNTIDGDLDDFPSDSIISTLIVGGSNTITGGFASLPTTLRILGITGNNTTIDGDVADLPAGITTVTISGINVINGNIEDVPSSIITFIVSGNNIIGGSLSNLPSDCAFITLNVLGANTIGGDLDALPNTLSVFQLLGNNVVADYTPPSAGHDWHNNMSTFDFRPAVGGGLSSTEVDQLIIDLDSETTVTRSPAGNWYITGNNAARTAASDAAVASLLTKGRIVNTNP